MKRFLSAIIFVFLACGIVYSQEADTKEKQQVKEKSAKEYIADLSIDKDEPTVLTAINWVIKEKEEDALPNLVNLLKDSRMHVRMESCSALGIIGEEKALPALHNTMLKDDRPEVRYAAVLATFRIGSKDSIDYWKQAKSSESDPFVKDILTKLEAKARGN